MPAQEHRVASRCGRPRSRWPRQRPDWIRRSRRLSASRRRQHCLEPQAPRVQRGGSSAARPGRRGAQPVDRHPRLNPATGRVDFPRLPGRHSPSRGCAPDPPWADIRASQLTLLPLTLLPPELADLRAATCTNRNMYEPHRVDMSPYDALWSCSSAYANAAVMIPRPPSIRSR